MVFDEFTKKIRKGVPWELMFTDDLARIRAESERSI